MSIPSDRRANMPDPKLGGRRREIRCIEHPRFLMRLGVRLMEVIETVRLEVVPRAGVEPARPYGQRILSP